MCRVNVPYRKEYSKVVVLHNGGVQETTRIDDPLS